MTTTADNPTVVRHCVHCKEPFAVVCTSSRVTCSSDCAIASARATRAAIAAGLAKPKVKKSAGPTGKTIALESRKAKAEAAERAILAAHTQRQINEVCEQLRYYELRLPAKAAELEAQLRRLKTLLKKQQEQSQ